MDPPSSVLWHMDQIPESKMYTAGLIMTVVASILARHLPHAQGRHDVSGPRLRPFQAPLHRPAEKAPGQALVRTWLRRGTQAPHCMSFWHCRGAWARSYRVSWESTRSSSKTTRCMPHPTWSAASAKKASIGAFNSKPHWRLRSRCRAG